MRRTVRLAVPAMSGLQLLAGDRPSRSESLLGLLLEALGEGVYGVDAQGRATFLNPAGSRLLGYTPEEFLGQRQHDLIHVRSAAGEPLPVSRCPIYAVLEDGITRRVEDEYFRHRDGRCFQVEYTATAVREAGGIAGVVVVFRDVTERSDAVRRLRAAHEQQQAWLENLGDAAWMKDAELRYVAVNETFVRLSGIPRDRLLGRTVHDFLDPEAAERYDAADRRVLEGGEPFTVTEDLPWASPDFTGYWIETVRRPIAGPDGRPVGVAGVSRDVTERRRREDADRFLAEAGQVIIASLAWTDILQGLSTLLVPRMGDWCIISMFGSEGAVDRTEVRAQKAERGERLRHLLARNPHAYGRANELVGRAILKSQAELLRDLPTTDLEALLGGMGEVDPVLDPAPGSALVVPLIPQATATGAVILVREGVRRRFDEADLLLIEEVVRRSALGLEYARQRAALQQAIRTRDEALRLVTHDLRNLVGAVGLDAHALLQADLPATHGQSAIRIGEAVHRMDRLMQDILDSGRTETGSLRVEPAKLEPATVIREALDAAAPMARPRGIALLGEPARDLPTVRADHGRVLQVLANLLGNATRFTPEGGEIRMAAERLGDEVVFSVRDTGVGIPAEDLTHILDGYWRTKRSCGGSGLGLAIARSIIAAHGGRIWASSEVSKGSCFCFTLPVLELSPDSVEAAGDHPGDPSSDPPLPDRSLRLLIVDDHEAIRAGVRVLLEPIPWIRIADEAVSGEEAIRKARLLDPDIIVMDLSLPGMDGFEAMRGIAALDRRIRILVLTAHAPERSLIKAMEAGAHGFVCKATAHQDLVPALRSVMNDEVFLDSRCNTVLARRFERALRARRQLATLSAHEQEIVRLTAAGHTAREIAEMVFLSPHTVASYRSQAMHKLGLEHRSELVHFALDTQLITAD